MSSEPPHETPFECPSPTMQGRVDKCGLFQYPHKCTPRYCTYEAERLATEQAEENAADPDHIAKVNDIARRAKAGERNPIGDFRRR